MTQPLNIITEFIEELLTELEVPSGTPEYSRLVSVLEERVTSRLFLNIIKSLTPEQAAIVSKDLTSESPDSDLVLEKLLDNAPHLQAVIAGSLGEIHIELTNDLKAIIQSQKA
jgi:hypothetical protein